MFSFSYHKYFRFKLLHNAKTEMFCSGEVTAAYTNTRMETLVLEMFDKVMCTINVKQNNKGFDKNKGLKRHA